MELFEISVDYQGEHKHFEVRDYMHHEGDQCKFEIYKEGKFIAGFEPGPAPHRHLNICKNAGVEKEELLNIIADQLEGYNL